MSLDYRLEEIEDWKNVCLEGGENEEGERKMRPVSETMIWATVNMGVNPITEKNWEQLYRRAVVTENLFGSYLYEGVIIELKNLPDFIKGRQIRQCTLITAESHEGVKEEDVGKFSVVYERKITEEDVKAHIGLRTNASSKTDAQFWKGVKDRVKDEVS